MEKKGDLGARPGPASIPDEVAALRTCDHSPQALAPECDVHKTANCKNFS